MSRRLHIVILAAGRGTRMKSGRPKVLHEVCGLPALAHVLRAAAPLGAERTTIVLPDDADLDAAVAALPEAAGAGRVVQEPPLGTGHAVEVALGVAPCPGGEDVLVLYGDGPLYRAETLRVLVEEHRRRRAAATLLTVEVEQPAGLGRVVRDPARGVLRIVEEKDATEAERAIREVFPGVLVFDRARGEPELARLTTDNAQGEKYLTDLIGHLVGQGCEVGARPLDDAAEALAFNTLSELARVRRALRLRLCEQWMARGVDIVDPATTYLDVDVEIGAGTVIHPCTVVRSGVRIGRDCVVGPFAHLRLAAVLEDRAEVGNFVEVKKSVVGEGSKAKHLTYLGDARIGRGANIGCGTITANWDGRAKHVTTIGDGAFVGSGTVLVAPCEVAAGGTTGAGAVVRRGERVGEGETWVGVPAHPLRGRPGPRAGEPPPGEDGGRR